MGLVPRVGFGVLLPSADIHVLGHPYQGIGTRQSWRFTPRVVVFRFFTAVGQFGRRLCLRPWWRRRPKPASGEWLDFFVGP